MQDFTSSGSYKNSRLEFVVTCDRDSLGSMLTIRLVVVKRYQSRVNKTPKEKENKREDNGKQTKNIFYTHTVCLCCWYMISI